VRYLALLACALVLAGCGGGGHARGEATLWVTRDRGAHVLYAGTVPAGLNGVQAVERKLKVTTRYGGHYVQSIDGLSGSLGAQRDWFFYVDGIEGGESAASVRIHPGDVLWWDYRHWTPGTMDIPVVVGAYPQPFRSHGPTSISGPLPLVRAIAGQVGGAHPGARNAIVIDGSVPPGAARIARVHGGYRLQLGLTIARRLAHDPTALRYRF
jgi:uncharacterized protein DUF4430